MRTSVAHSKRRGGAVVTGEHGNENRGGQEEKGRILTDAAVEFTFRFLPLVFSKPMGDKICYPTY